MTPLRIGTHGLQAMESGLVRAQLKLLAIGDPEDFPWAYVEAPPYDALLVDAAVTGPRREALRAHTRAVLVLRSPGEAASPAAEALSRPLRASELDACLRRLQGQLGAVGAAPVPPPAGGALPRRFRLKRWPPAELLHGDRHRVRMATLLAKRPLSLEELARLSEQPDAHCRLFVQLLHGFSLLEEPPATPMPAASPGAAPAGPARPPVRDAARDTKWTLVRSIRARLGLHA